ncbi:metadherin a isoform X2 [Betta splendens]|uniref:Metadherin a isoform X2 n=1 Tax=Betta splendens TaxID=158456 RepID=A0A6P7NRH7_BETSP|nr:metadherin a isoform X2 [Betta splendens]
MAEDLKGFAVEKAELLSRHLKELLSSGQGYVRARLGVDLGLQPELYPTWVMVCTAAVGLLLIVGASWAAACGAFAGKKRGSPVSRGSGEPVKASLPKAAKAEEQKKRNKKKTPDKVPLTAGRSQTCRFHVCQLATINKTQSNGQPVTTPQEEVKEAVVVSKPSPQIKTEKVHEACPPVQAKKNKKKAKSDVKPVQQVSTHDGKEPDDGAWETKVSNREKRQQRRKDRGPEDSGSPGGVEASKTQVTSPAASAPPNPKRNRGNHEPQHSRPTGKGDAASGAGKDKATWREEPFVNGGGWADISLKLPSQMGSTEGAKWSTVSAAPHYRAQADSQRWGQETQAWTGIDGRAKTDINPVTLSILGLNKKDPISNSVELQWTKSPDAADEWSGFNGMAAADPSCDWNAPAEHWGNYEEPPVLMTPAPLAKLKEQPEPSKVSEDDKDVEDPSGGAARSKKKRKKKKKTEEEAATDAQMPSQASLVSPVPKAQELPVLAAKKPSSNISSQKSEHIVEPPKPSQKKKRCASLLSIKSWQERKIP